MSEHSINQEIVDNIKSFTMAEGDETAILENPMHEGLRAYETSAQGTDGYVMVIGNQWTFLDKQKVNELVSFVINGSHA